jgi:FkbM family methyltransferase
MIKRAIVTLAQCAAGGLGFEIRRRGWRSADGRHARDSLAGLLQQVRGLGFSPATVLDVGAAHGWFHAACRQVYPDSRYVLIEPLEEYRSVLDVAAAMPRTELIQAAACARSGPITINVHADLVGSSLYREQEATNVDGVPRTVRGITLDELGEEKELAGPYLLKLDVQGAELDVLEGAGSLLRETEYILTEVSMFQFFHGGPQL